MRLETQTTFLMALLFPVAYFNRWNERQRRRKAIEMRLATLLTLVLRFPVTTALVYSQEVHYNYERGANFSAYKTYQWIDDTVDPITFNPASTPKVEAGALSNVPGLPTLPAPPAISFGGARNYPGGTSDVWDNRSEDQLINQEIKRAVDEQLAQKGLTKVDKGADLRVGYHAAIRQEQSLYLSGMSWGGRGMGGGWTARYKARLPLFPSGRL